jgi:ribosomal protein L37E
MKKKLSNPQNYVTFFILGMFLLFAIASGGKKTKSNKSNTNNSTKTYKSETPSWTCRNCKGHSYHLKDEWLKICNSCGFAD